MSSPPRPRDPDFDETLDGDPEVCLALSRLFGRQVSPAKLLFEHEHATYWERRADWIQNNISEVLADGVPREVAKSNRERFDAVCELVGRASIVPFVGAGLSIPCGMPGWSSFLLSLAARKRKKGAVRKLLKRGLFEEAATLVVDTLKEGEFIEAYRSAFRVSAPVRGPSKKLGSIARRAVVTTNFDDVLTQVFGARFRATFLGLESADFRPHLACGEQVLLKMHGDLYRPSSRVLTSSEYDKAYGPCRKTDFARPIPRGLRLLFTTSTLLFLGCSLGPDRTLQVFKEVVQEEGGVQFLPRHYALLPWDASRGRSNALTDVRIYPIWYAKDRHDVVDTLVSYLAEEVAP